MKTKSLMLRELTHARRVPRQLKPARQDGSPPVAIRTRELQAPARCERCDAHYEGKTWRVPARRAPLDPSVELNWTLCPACTQIEEQEYFGRVSITGALSPELEIEVRRRIWNVEHRARYTQPEHRLVRIERRLGDLEVLTTSQKLAHRVARELQKAFGGHVEYEWNEHDGSLEAAWEPPAKRAPLSSRHARNSRAR